MFSLLTGLLFALASYSVHHLTNIYLLHLLHLHMIKLHPLHCDALLDFIHVLVLPWFALHSVPLHLSHHARLHAECHRRSPEPANHRGMAEILFLYFHYRSTPHRHRGQRSTKLFLPNMEVGHGRVMSESLRLELCS